MSMDFVVASYMAAPVGDGYGKYPPELTTTTWPCPSPDEMKDIMLKDLLERVQRLERRIDALEERP